MKNMYSNFKINKKANYLLLLLTVLLGNLFSVQAQVRVPFTQRTSVYSPTKTIYNVKGDFTMIGNTNLTLVNYGDETSNNNNMRYVDIDNDTNTWNSSSANLVLSTENGANPACSNIVYAGLYWTGRASDASTSPNIFTVERQVPGGIVNVNNNYTVGHNQTITNTTYNLSITRNSPTNTNRSPIYTFISGTNTYVFNFTNNTGANRVTLSVNGGTAVNIPVNYTTSGSIGTATLTTPYVINDGSVNLTINSLERNTATNLSTTDTQNTSFANVNVNGTIQGTTTISKTYDKRKVSIKGPNSSAYTLLTAQDDDIYYPVNSDGFMYSGYIEVTDYVRANGLGAYSVADIALIEGNGGGTGYYGGWGMVVVYENDKMKWRDVTVFDGHSYVAGSITADFEIPVAGFNTVQSGPVNMKLGMMAGEGDRNIAGDFFQIRNFQDNNWVTLNHGANSTNNFFNSSIFTGGNTRVPDLINNTGLDISMFTIPNTNNAVITNNQTSTRFRYGTTQDTYVIYNITMSVDAYIPEIEGLLTVQNIGGAPASPSGPYNAQPGQEVEFGVDIKNLGTEAVNNYKLVIPIPFTSTFVPGSLNSSILFTPNPSPNNLYFDPNLGATGSIVWDFGTLPLPADPQTLLASLRFKLRATDNCAILSNPNCANNILVNGLTFGTGAITNIAFKDRPLILGYNNSGACQGEPIYQPITVNIIAGNYVAQNCSNVPLVQNFYYCNGQTNVTAAQLASAFPPGSLFYSAYPVPAGAAPINNFPIVAGVTNTYFAVPFNADGCFFEFTISACRPIDAVDDIAGPINGASGQNGVVNVFDNDTLNGVILNPADVALTLVTPDPTGALTLNPDGSVDVAPGTPAGTYSLTYQICENVNPGNCDTAVVTITVSAPVIDAMNDNAGPINGASGQNGVVNVFDNDTLNGVILNPADVALTLVTPDPTGALTLNPDGSVDVAPGTPAGTYSLTYQICENVNPGNCDTAVVTITVSTPVIDAVNDNYNSISCITNGVIGNILSNDTLDNNPATSLNVSISITSGNSPNVTIDNQGNISVNSGIPAGQYNIGYTICEILNPNNCSSALITINIVDTIPPVISNLPAETTIQCPATPEFAVATANDSCGSASITFDDEIINGNCAGNYTIIRTWTAIDQSGNTSSSSQTITVNDTIAPSFVEELPADVTVECNAVPTATTLTATDNCGDATVTFAEAIQQGDCPNAYVVTRTWTATDACENQTVHTQIITVQDTIAPAFVEELPADVTVECNAVPTAATLTATDNCGDATVTFAEAIQQGDCPNAYVVT
ncbi:hypothetical protein B0I10_101344, partial [Flavobacterium lacus]